MRTRVFTAAAVLLALLFIFSMACGEGRSQPGYPPEAGKKPGVRGIG